MKERMSRALVPVLARLPALWPAPAPQATAKSDFDLVQHETRLHTRSQVERYLPDILGRALARTWIDASFRLRFGADPKLTLAAYGVHLPDTIEVDFVTEGTLRPQIVVYEQSFPNSQRRRLLYLQLVMMAGK
jgi:hypothetical protein